MIHRGSHPGPARVCAALRPAGRGGALLLRPADYEALRTTSRELPEPLVDHARELAPAADYGLRVGPLALLNALGFRLTLPSSRSRARR